VDGHGIPRNRDLCRAARDLHRAIDREADIGTYFDPNVWIVHDLG
jgi:hypothetical protein